VFPATREQRCWVHKAANVLGALPTSVHAGARRALNEILGAEDRAHAEQAIQALVADYGAKWPKAVAKVVDDQEALLAFFDYPAEHWLHLRTTDESFKARVCCRPAGRGLACSAGVVDPGAKSRVVGLGALPRSLPLEGPTVAPQWWRPRPLRSGRHRGLVAGRLGCQSATSWR
jgi:Transposase, Mutator family